MQPCGKVLVAAILALGAFGAGSAAAQEASPAPRAPVILNLLSPAPLSSQAALNEALRAPDVRAAAGEWERLPDGSVRHRRTGVVLSIKSCPEELAQAALDRRYQTPGSPPR